MPKFKLPVLPSMRCDEGCGECCGPVLCSEDEFARIRRFIAERGIAAVDRGKMTCPFLREGRCTIYAVRPFVCRLFGHVAGLTCSRGYNVNVSPEEERRFLRRHCKPERSLHEFVGYSRDEMITLLFSPLRVDERRVDMQ